MPATTDISIDKCPRSSPPSWLSLGAEEKFRRHTSRSGLAWPLMGSGQLFWEASITSFFLLALCHRIM